MAQAGELGRIYKSKALTELWEWIVERGDDLARETTIEEVVRTKPIEARRAALSCPRAFVQYINLLDDTLKVPVLKDFHVKTIRSLRQQQHALCLLPFAHGKSWLANVLIPLMDWAEHPEFTQGRVYYNDQFKLVWARKLMYILETNKELRTLFPAVQRPMPESPAKAWWSTDGFSIDGKRSMEPSFEAFGAGAGITGRRYWRVICDDWVVSEIASSETVNQKLWDYFHTGCMSMTKPVPFESLYNTMSSTVGVVGTLFHKRDFNYRLAVEWREFGYKVYRVDVYKDRSQQEVIWPEERPLEYISRMKRSMGDQAFRLRCRNLVTDETDVTFREADVNRAVSTSHGFGSTLGLPCLIGFDPAAGKKTRDSKNPAAVCLAFDRDKIHVVRWARWNMPMPGQVNALADWARLYNCPVAVEDASQQIAYKHWMNLQHPDVKVISHTTKYTKRDWIQGVESLIPYFEQDRIIIHGGDASESALRELREELIAYPQGKTTDLVMAMWIAKHQWELLLQRNQGDFYSQKPAYAGRGRGGGVIIDLKALRGAHGAAQGWTGIPQTREQRESVRREAQRNLRDLG